MEFLMIFSFHFFIMGSIVMLLSGLISFFFPKITVFIVVVLLSMLIGYTYSVVYEVPNLALFSVILNGILSLLAVGLVKTYFYSKQKVTEEINDKYY